MRRVSAASILAIVVLCFPGPALASDLYRWTDDKGVLHVATSLSDVPEEYLDQVLTMKADPASVPKPQTVSDPSSPVEDSAPTDDTSGLARFEVPYQNEGSSRRVIIPVKFNDAVTAPMALDTGSPGLVISAELAVKLGIFSRDNGTLLTTTSGIGGQALAVLTIVDSVSVQSARDVFIPTTVTEGISDAFDGLIGMDFLANYTISIDSRKQVVVFQENPSNPNFRGGHDEGWWRNTFEEFRSASNRWSELAKSGDGRSGAQDMAFFEFQAREAEKLLQRLDNYASDNYVPRHWR